jgi:hypothetical protein
MNYSSTITVSPLELARRAGVRKPACPGTTLDPRVRGKVVWE